MVTNSIERGPVQARSVATRAALLDAALECLVADGYASLTTNEIARRAGVSRGAQLHHFPTKAELLAAAVEHLLLRRVREYEVALRSRAPGTVDVGTLVDLVWPMFEGDAFIAWVELWVAARTDAELAATMVDVDRRFSVESRALAVELLADVTANPAALPELELARDVSFAFMTGVAVTMLVPRGQRPTREYIAVLEGLLASMLGDRV